MTKKKWIKTGMGNIVIEADWGRISYRKEEGLEGGEETALFCSGNEKYKKFKILIGDFRKEYEKVFPDLEECLKIYDKYKDQYRSKWSTD